MDLSWMAWTAPTALFFGAIGTVLALMAALYTLRPGGGEPRPGLFFGLATTRGDRLFISLLGSAFIHLAWLGATGYDLKWAAVISLIYAAIVFRWG
jgi:predicted small integral membrane protein